MPRAPNKYYAECDSPFYRLRSRARLASLLRIGRAKLQQVANLDDLYITFRKPKTSGGFRVIDAPRNDLKNVQARIANLLQRISPPEYLFAPVTGRSYVDNAATHVGSRSICLLDIEDFFPNCTANRVIWFFHKRMKCSRDVSAILRGIVTHHGTLPQGSPCSPILAYFSYVDMWEEIARIAENNSCTLSVYADDITVSGQMVPKKALWQIRQVLRKHGHRCQASKVRCKHQKPAEITGVIVRPDRLHAPNRLHKKLLAVRREFNRAVASGRSQDKIRAILSGREAQMNQITSRNSL